MVKASFERIASPPDGIVSLRKSTFELGPAQNAIEGGGQVVEHRGVDLLKSKDDGCGIWCLDVRDILEGRFAKRHNAIRRAGDPLE